MDYSTISSLPNLGPGSSGSDVITLQKWLVSNGFMTQDQMNTGPGVYGPKTTAAVAAWQQQAGFNTQGNPGWFGPLSKTYIQTQSQPKTPTQQPAPTAQLPTTSNLQKSVLSAVADVAQQAATLGKPTVSFADALKTAANDPNIVAKYSDMLKLDKEAFQQQLQALQLSTSTEMDQYKTQFENERKALAEQHAAAGTAYSGFRGKAQADLAKNEAGIVTSSRSQLQQKVNDLTSAFEAKYGTGAGSPASAMFANPLLGGVSPSGLKTAPVAGVETIAGQQAGGITGTVAPAKAADVRGSALESYQAAQFPAI